MRPNRDLPTSKETDYVYNLAAVKNLLAQSQIPSATQLMFMRAVGRATITFDPHFTGSQITPLFLYLALFHWLTAVLLKVLISNKSAMA